MPPVTTASGCRWCRTTTSALSAASFNRMQAGLAERERLQAAFGSYVDPALATRLLAQGDDIFTGERLEVTVMFVDVRDFTPFAEAHAAEDAVAHLNALFEIVVPAVLDAGGHVNKYLGDGAMAVFGAPNALAHHADAAVDSALLIQQRVAEHFAGELRIGIGINTGTGHRRHDRRGGQARVHPHRRRRQRRRAGRATHQDDGRHDPLHPAHPRRPRQTRCGPHRPRRSRPEGQVGDASRLCPRTTHWLADDVGDQESERRCEADDELPAGASGIKVSAQGRRSADRPTSHPVCTPRASRVLARTAIVAPPANAWAAAMLVGLSVSAAAKATTVTTTRTTPTPTHNSRPCRAAIFPCDLEHGAAPDRLGGVPDDDRHQQHHGVAGHRDAQGGVLRDAVEPAPSIGAQPTDAAPRRDSITWLART